MDDGKRAAVKAELEDAKAAVAEAIALLPLDQRAAVPTDTEGNPQVQIVQALYRYERTKPHEVTLHEVRELSTEEWDAVMAAHSEIYRLTRGLDAFPSFAWGDLRNARDELLRQLREHTWPDDWMMPLIEYRLISFSTALTLYYEYVKAQVSRAGDSQLKHRVLAMFSELYDHSFAYRLIFSLRNGFQHGASSMVSLQMTARFAQGSDTQRESVAHAYLDKVAFAGGRSNAAVRHEVDRTDGEIDLFELSEKAFLEIQELHSRLTPHLHPAAPAAAQLLIQYISELGGERPHFHEYIRGLPTKAILGTTALDRGGFQYVARQAGQRATYEEDHSPTDALAVLPTYPSSSAASDSPETHAPAPGR